MESNEFILRQLTYPEGMVDVVLDTDTFNEVDDQFALAYLLRSRERVRLQAVYAAPFFNENSNSPADGMEKSYREIGKIAELCGCPEMKQVTFRGATGYLPDAHTPVDSPAAQDLVARAMAQPEGKPLYVIGIACITNVASALLLEPPIARKIVLVWLGGHAHHWPHTREFNMAQDVAAAQVVFGCGVPLVQVPCFGVVTHLAVSPVELQQYMKGKNPLCDYLYSLVCPETAEMQPRVWSRVIWDVAAAAWIVRRTLTEDTIVHSPIPTADGYYAYSTQRHPIRYVHYVNRDAILNDLFRKLTDGGN